MSPAEAAQLTPGERSVDVPLRARGYLRFDAAAHLDDIDVAAALAALNVEFESLPRDPYAHSLNRFRRYVSGLLFPWARRVEWLPTVVDDRGRTCSEYYQGVHNPDHPGIARRFEAISRDCLRNPLVERLIWIDFDHTFWQPIELRRPLSVGLHLVKLMVAQPGQSAVSSPNHLHQDGEPFTFVHLVHRDNAVGAVNTIAWPDCVGLLPENIADDLVVDTFQLEEPLDSYAICDRMISHYVSPLTRGPEARAGVRCAVLIDFTPMVPRI